MPSSINLKEFTDIISGYKGYSIKPSTKHHKIVNPDGDKVAGFAIGHSKGKKPFVLQKYVKRVIQAIETDIDYRKTK